MTKATFCRLALLLGALASAACFLGYDSSWGQAKAAQRRLASESTPGPIAVAPEEHAEPTVTRTYRVRFRPNAHYLSQTVTSERQIREVLSDADGLLRLAVGLHLELDKIEPWSFDADDKLEPTLRALRKDDPGQDVDVVVGLIGALPNQTDSFHEIGYAEMLGKHMLVRAASRLGEHDAFDRALADLSDEERERVVRARRRHRAEAVFLHELGHLLGALHETEITSLMHPAYDKKMSEFGDDAVRLMRLALTGKDRAAIAQAQLDYLRGAKSASWVESDRDEEEKHLEAMAAPAPAPPSSAADGGGSPAGALGAPAAAQAPPELKEGDQERFIRAKQMLKAAAVAAAYRTAQPLFAAYPNSRDVQDLRCQLATVRYLDKDALRAECAPYTRLSDGGVAPPTP